MKLSASTLILCLGFLLIPATAQTQEQNDCFMLDGNGEAINLGDLCVEGLAPAANPDIFAVPIKRREANIAVIDVVLNGQQTFEMLVDTGASGSVITPAMAQSLDLEIEGTTKIATAGGVVQAYVARLNSLAAGGITVNNLLVVIAPNVPMGLLGQDFFGDYDLVIRENTVEFHVRK